MWAPCSGSWRGRRKETCRGSLRKTSPSSPQKKLIAAATREPPTQPGWTAWIAAASRWTVDSTPHALGRAWLPTHQALLKATAVRILLWVQPMAELVQPSTSAPVRIPRPAKLRNYRNLPTACKLLLLVYDCPSASDLLSHPIQQRLRRLGLMFTSLQRQTSQAQVGGYLSCAAK